MLAAVCSRYGPPEVFALADVPAPRPGPEDLLVRVRASTVNSSDVFVRSGIPTAPLPMRLAMRAMIGFLRPRRPILGLILAGEVEAVGSAVSRFRPGDRVWAFTKFRMGGYAQHACVGEHSTVALAPSNWPLEESAAVVYGGLLALHYLERARVQSGQRVAIYGAAGGVGTAAVQLARHLGAEVTAVCGTASRALVLGLGAHEALDYTRDAGPPTGQRYDVVLDAVGKRKTSPLRLALEQALAPGGRVVSVDDGTPELTQEQLVRLTGLTEAGAIRPVIDRVYSLEQIVAAHAYVDGEHKHGNVVIAVG